MLCAGSCVNTVRWTRCGSHLITGSDDTRILIFNTDGQQVQEIQSGHFLNIFSAYCLAPTLRGGVIVSCGACVGGGVCTVQAHLVYCTYAWAL
jgi:hypothetical protein